MRRHRKGVQQRMIGTGLKLRVTLALGFLAAVSLLGGAPSNNPFPIRNGVLQTDLNANNFQITNLDTSNLAIGGGSGNDTGTTTNILKGDGNHGFSDAVAGTDYLTPTGSGLLLTGVVLTANNLSDLADAATGRLNLGLNNVDNTSDANKPVSTATTTALGLKADASSVTTALALKADTTALTTGLALKEDTLPTTGNDGYILARDIDDTWHFVDPVTLGTTSQTFTDGVENTTTTFTSASANFVAGDVGKTITGDNIDPGTTIASRTNSTTIILSQAATATGSGNTFTILNRLEVGGTGTVTIFSVTNLVPGLLTLTLQNASTSPHLTFEAPTQPPFTFYGNQNSFTGAPAFMTAAAARSAMGLGTLALQANTGTSIAIQKGNGTGGLSPTVAGTDYLAPGGSGTGLTGVLKTASNLSDLGNLTTAKANLGLALVASSGAFFDITAPTVGANTFYGNQNATTGSATFMTATAARASLGGSTAGQNIFTITNPSAMSFVRINADLTVSTRTPAQMIADLNGTVNAGAGGTLTITATNPPTNTILLNTTLTSTLDVVLPAANTYAVIQPIEIIDVVGGSQTNFGVTVRRSSTDSVDGSTAPVPLPRGISYVRFNSNNSNKWTSTLYYLSRLQDFSVPSKVASFDLTALPTPSAGASPNIINVAAGSSTTVKPNAVTAHTFVKNIDSGGTAAAATPAPTDLLPNEEVIGTTGQTISGATKLVTNDGSIDTVRIAGNLAGAYTIKVPDAALYESGKTITIIDASGSVGDPSTTVVTVTSTNGTDLFNPETASGVTTGQPSFLFDEQNGRKVITSNGVDGWTVPTTKTSISGYKAIPNSGGTFTINGNSQQVQHNGYIQLQSGVNNLAVSSAYDGMNIELVLKQPASGSAATLALPQVSRVGPAGVGVVTLSSVNAKVDVMKGRYVSALSAFLWDAPVLDYSSIPAPTAPSGLTATAISANQIDLAWADNSNNETGFEVYRAAGVGGSIFNLLTTRPAAATSYSDTNVVASTGYNYHVRAINAGGNSNYTSNANAFTPSGALDADKWNIQLNEGTGQTANPTSGPIGNISLPLKWTTSTQSGSGAAFAATAGMQSTTGIIITQPNGAVSPGTQYQYRVYAHRTNGGVTTQNASNTGTTITGPATLNNTDKNHIVWTAVTNATSYDVWRVTGGTPGLIATSLTVPATGYDDNGSTISPGTIASALSSDNSTIKSASSITWGSQVLSVIIWVKSAFGGGTANLVSLSNGGPTNTIDQIAGTKFNIVMAGTSGNMTGTVDNSSLNDGAWHMVTVVMDNSTTTNTPSSAGTSAATDANIRVYFDNNATPRTVTFAAPTRSAAATTFPPNFAIIGGQLFTGSVDDVGIFSAIGGGLHGALSTAEIAAIYAVGAR